MSRFPNDDMTIELAVESEFNITSRKTGKYIEAFIPLGVSFNVVTSTGTQLAFKLGCYLSSYLDISIKNATAKGVTGNEPSQKIAGYLKNLTIDEINVLQTNVGKIEWATVIRLAIDEAIQLLLLPLINEKLECGVPIPSTSFMTLIDTEIQHGDGCAIIGSDVSIDLAKLLGEVEQDSTGNYAMPNSSEDTPQRLRGM